MFTRKKVSVPESMQAKWSASVMDEGFLPFPKKLLRTLGDVFKDLVDLQVILAIVDFRRLGLARPPSYDFLAFTAGMPVEDFKSRVQAMQDRRWLTASGPDVAVDIELNGLLQLIVEEANKQDALGPFFGGGNAGI